MEIQIELTSQQKQALSYMDNGKNVFLTGSGGTGKSQLIKLFYKRYKNRRNIAMTSTTGTSALLLKGSTLHSYTGIGLGTGSIGAITTKIFKKPYLRRRWQNLDILIIDEISMLSPDLFDKLEEIARIIRYNDKPFGGVQLVLTGDYLQLPVIDSDKFCFQAETWKKCVDHTIYFKKIFRQDDPVFQKCLNNIRIGHLDNETIQVLQSRVNANLSNNNGIKPSKLFPLNASVDHINRKALCKFNKQEFFQYEREVEIYSKKHNMLRERLVKYCTAPECLELTKGAQVRLIWNLSLEDGLVNGSRGVVVDFIEDLPKVKFMNGMERVIDYNIWEFEQEDEKIGRIIQIPLKVAFACSIHSTQGATLDCVEVDLENIFEYGQAYVALSRVKTLNGLTIKGLDLDKIQAHPEAIKYYKELESS